MKFNKDDKVYYRTIDKNGKIVSCINPDAPESEHWYYVEIKKQIWSCPGKNLLKITQ